MASPKDSDGPDQTEGSKMWTDMPGGKKPLQDDRFKVKKPVKIQYASAEEVSAATDEILRQHSYLFELLAKK
jgi:hypothetical protein